MRDEERGERGGGRWEGENEEGVGEERRQEVEEVRRSEQGISCTIDLIRIIVSCAPEHL